MLPKGFRAAGLCAGIKGTEKKDLGLLHADVPANAAGVFTTNRVQAAPVLLDRKRIRSGRCRSIIVNSGNANCCTGPKGMQDAETMTRCTASALGVETEEVLAASTGVIGEPLPIERIENAIPELVRRLRPEGFLDFAEAILTTDTRPKVVSRKGVLDGVEYTVTGIAKGAGMIHPHMATLLCFVCTDLEAPAKNLHQALFRSVEGSLNRISIDGDMSTNDTVLILANGASGAALAGDASLGKFQRILDDVLGTLARDLVRDGEGVTKVVEVIVEGALSAEAARRVAETVATSSLVKTALFGEDANWGRILAAVGRAGVWVDPEKIDVFFNEVHLVKGGVGCGKTAEAEATRVLRRPEFCLKVSLGQGAAATAIVTCDLSVDYVKINAHYRS